MRLTREQIQKLDVETVDVVRAWLLDYAWRIEFVRYPVTKKAQEIASKEHDARNHMLQMVDVLRDYISGVKQCAENIELAEPKDY